VKGIHDVIKHAKFGDDRLRGTGVVAGQISAFPIDYFAGRPYNTLTLPCERVILSLYQTKIIVHSYWCKYDLVIFTITMCTKLEVQCSLVSRSYNYDLLN